MLTPLLDQCLGLFHRAENLPVEQLVSELAVEAFIVPVLPWATWLDKEGLHADPFKPFAKGYCDKLWTIVGSDIARHAMLQHCVGDSVQDIARAQLALHFDGQAFSSVLIDQRQHAERTSIMCSILDEVIGPDMVLMLRPEPHA